MEDNYLCISIWHSSLIYCVLRFYLENVNQDVIQGNSSTFNKESQLYFEIYHKSLVELKHILIFPSIRVYTGKDNYVLRIEYVQTHQQKKIC